MIATFYARVSTDLDQQQQSIANQVEYFKEYLRSHNFEHASGCGQISRKDGSNEALEGYYVDEGLTASKSDTKNRRAFNQMIKDAKAGKFTAIFVKSISRFSRSVETTIKVIKDLKELGVGVYFDDIKMNSIDGQNEMLITMFASVAQEESRVKSENIHFGIMRGIKNEKWTSSAPFGYDKIDGYLQINEDEAAVVRMIYEMYINEGLGIKLIAKRLTELKIPTKRSYSKKNGFSLRKWHHSTIKNIVNNPIHTGRMMQNRTRKTDINRGIIKYNPVDEYIVHKLERLRIIDDNSYKILQIEKDERMKKLGTYDHLTRTREDVDGMSYQKVRVQVKNRTERHSAAHLFSNIFYCGHCDVAMRRRKSYHLRVKNKNIKLETLPFFYVCATFDIYGKAQCNYRNMSQEHEIINWVKERIKEKQNIDTSFYIDELININYDTSNNSEEVERLEAEYKELETEKTGLIKMKAKELISEGEFKSEYKKIMDEIELKTKELNKEQQIFKEIDRLKEEYYDYMEALKSFDFDNITNRSLKKIIKKIKIVTDNSDGRKNKLFYIEWKFLNMNQTSIAYESVKKFFNEYQG
ncbi:recombinase family protein [Paenibacillus sp. N1-5-1-14]|uniref:recombinase family protein n=1 Tax=Paenibacillus radicibacter TaxID=2972488 RepID=UPI002159A0A8|nr:recombinase family protein [Paenibacillus radicibacter]MCR8641363.1 recombinase family protein [Paenibacillus radicibacter]